MFNPKVYLKDIFRGRRLKKLKVEEHYNKLKEEEMMLKLIAPDRFEEYDTHLLIDRETFVRCIVGGMTDEDLDGIPVGMTSRALERIMSLSYDGAKVDISTGLIKIPRAETSKDLKEAYINNSIDQETARKYTQGSINDLQLENEAHDIRATYNEIYYNSQNVYYATFIITIMGGEKEVYQAEAQIKGILQSELIEYVIPYNLMMPAFIASRPFPTSDKRFWIRVHSDTAAVLCTATSLNSRIDEEGLYFGKDKKTNAEVMINIKGFPSQHMVIFGPTGSGKSFTVSMLIMRVKDFYDKRVCVVTPKRENDNFRAVASYYGEDAVVVDIGEFGEPINPLQIMYDAKSMGNSPEEYSSAYFRHIRILKNFFGTWLEDEFSANMKGYLEDSLHELYKSKGIIRTKPETWKNEFPVLSELRAKWERDMNNDSVRSNTQRSAEALFRKTSAIGADGSLSYLNRPPKEPVDFSRGLIVFDISGVDEEIKPAMNVLVTGMLGSRFRTDLEKETIIVVDEARVFLRNEHLSTFLLDTVAMGRSYGIALWLITQNPGDLAKNGVEEEFRTNMPLSIVMGATLDPSKVGPIQRYFNLSETAVNDLLQCDQGDGLLLMRGEEIPLKFEPTQHEYDIIKGTLQTERPSPVSGYNSYTIIPEFEHLKTHHGVILKEWIEGDDSILSSQGWEKITRLPTVTGRGSCTMWVPRGSINGNLIQLQTDDGKKKLGKMTVEHFACVVQMESFLTAKNIKCSSDHNREADIIFEINDKIYAIEYEKAGTRTDKQLVEKKERLHSFDDFRFVCSSKDYEIISRSVSTEYTVTRGKEFVQWVESLEEPLINNQNEIIISGYLAEEDL